MEEVWYKVNRTIHRQVMLASRTYITAATPQLDWGRLSPKEIHDLSFLQREALVYIGNPQAPPIPKTVGWVASV